MTTLRCRVGASPPTIFLRSRRSLPFSVEGWTAFLTIAYMSREQAARFHAKRVMLDAATDMLAETTI